MEKPVLYANSSEESNKAKQLLQQAGIEFISLFEAARDEPILIVKESDFSYRGVVEIEEYCESHKFEIA